MVSLPRDAGASSARRASIWPTGHWVACSFQNPDSKDELVTTTVRDYDLAETGKAMKGLFTGMAFMAFLHLYMGYIPPVSTVWPRNQISRAISLAAIIGGRSVRHCFSPPPSRTDVVRVVGPIVGMEGSLGPSWCCSPWSPRSPCSLSSPPSPCRPARSAQIMWLTPALRPVHHHRQGRA